MLFSSDNIIADPLRTPVFFKIKVLTLKFAFRITAKLYQRMVTLNRPLN